MKSFYFFALLSLLVACRPEPIDINVASKPEQLVVFTEVVPDHAIFLSVTRTFSPLNGDPTADISSLMVPNATITLTSGTTSYLFSEVNPGLYVSYNAIAFEADKQYDLTVEAEGKVVYSSSIMLPKVSFSSILPSVEKLPQDTNVYVDFTFDDIPNIDNWYVINFYKKGTMSNDLMSYFQNGSNENCKTILVSDKEFNTTYSKKMFLPNLKGNDSLVVTLSNVSENYFNYLNFRVNSGSLFNQLNLEPINYPTNIINGYGFFNMHNPDIQFYDLSQF